MLSAGIGPLSCRILSGTRAPQVPAVRDYLRAPAAVGVLATQSDNQTGEQRLQVLVHRRDLCQDMRLVLGQCLDWGDRILTGGRLAFVRILR